MRLMSYKLIPYYMKKALLLVALLPLLSRSQDLAARADELLSAYHKQGKFNGTVLLARERDARMMVNRWFFCMDLMGF